jgi:hypothetical protein
MSIRFDAVSNGTTSWTHTCTWSPCRLLFVAVRSDRTGSGVTGVTYGGVAMTLLVGSEPGSPSLYFYTYYLVNPLGGANTVSVSGGLNPVGLAVSYAGVLPSDPTVDPPSSHDGNADADCEFTPASVVGDVTVLLLQGSFITIKNGTSRYIGTYVACADVAGPSGTVGFNTSAAGSHTGVCVVVNYQPGGGKGIAISPNYVF